MCEMLVAFSKRLLRSEAGVTLVEYAVALTLVISLGIAALTVLAAGVTDAMTAASDGMVDP